MTDLGAYFSDQAQYQRLLAEAEFGFSEISPHLATLPANADVLEIGSGTGVLSAMIADAHPGFSLDAVEPLGSGFSAFEQAMEGIAGAHDALNLHRTTAEAFDPGETRYDLIFSVNVFEHLSDWRLAFRRLAKMLKPDGRMIILCPNYTVPYESHFGIPLVFGASLSRRLFARRIAHVERTANAAGLWESLNFITSTQLGRLAREEGVSLAFDRGIMDRMFSRLTRDREFAGRQGAIGMVARVVNTARISAIFSWLPVSFSPYMKAVASPGAKDRH